MAGRLSLTQSASQITQPQAQSGVNVPHGHIVMGEKWRGSEIATKLQGSLNVLCEDRLGVIDFYPSSDMAVVYMTEGDLVAGTSYRRKLAKLRMMSGVKGVVIVEKTVTTDQYFNDLQKFAVLDLGLSLLPVTKQSEAADILVQLVHVENRPSSNQFRLKRRPPPVHAALLATVRLIPKLGDVKAKALLQRFHSIQGICEASVEDMSQVIGRASAIHVKAFFCEPATP